MFDKIYIYILVKRYKYVTILCERVLMKMNICQYFLSDALNMMHVFWYTYVLLCIICYNDCL